MSATEQDLPDYEYEDLQAQEEEKKEAGAAGKLK
jgi:hypothetical protein